MSKPSSPPQPPVPQAIVAELRAQNISRNTLVELLNMLNQGVGEIEAQLFEMR